MTALNIETRGLSSEQLEIVTGGMLVRGDQYKAINQWVHPLDIVSVKAVEVEIVAIGR